MFATSFANGARYALFANFVRRDIATRYTGTLMGGLWALGQPVLMLLIYGFVFRHVFRVELPDLAPNSFVAFVACALWPWLAFQEAVQRATQAVVGSANLVRKVAFPSQLLVLASVSASFGVHALGFTAVLAMLSLGGEPFHAVGLVVAVLGWGVLFVLACGIALMTAALQVVLKDIDHVLGPVFMLMFYVTPILYPLVLVPGSLRPYMALNPLLHVFEPMRAALLDGRLEPAWSLLPMAFGALAVAALGAWVFGRLAAHFEDFL